MGKTKRYEVVIIGGGVTGTAIAYVLARFTNVHSIALVEKYERVATVNSSPANNSQTLHFGDIETNYSLHKALQIQEAAEMIRRFVLDQPLNERFGLFQITPKMVLAVGKHEVAQLRARYEEFCVHYPGMEFLDNMVEIAKIEPALVYGRKASTPMAALLSHDGYAINYQMLSEKFVEQAHRAGKTLDEYYNLEVEQIVRVYRGGQELFRLEAGEETFEAPVVVVAAGPFSLRFAQAMGIGGHLGIMPVAGSFYFTRKDVLNGKVYTMQKEGLPFAAVHGDPDVVAKGVTRFGPTAKVLPLLERHKYRSMRGFFRRPVMSLAGVLALLSILRDLVVAKFLVENFFYDVPIVGKWLFLRKARKIVPSLRYRDLVLGKDLGGIRPQVVDTAARTMQMGESKLVGDGIIFNTTPSPGASNALANAERDSRQVIEFLNDGSRKPSGPDVVEYRFFDHLFADIYRF